MGKRTDAVWLVEIVFLLAIGIEFPCLGEDWKRAVARWRYRVRGIFASCAIEVAPEYTGLAFFAKEDQCIGQQLEG